MLLRGLLLLTIAAPLAAHETFVPPVDGATARAPRERRLSSTARFRRPETSSRPARVVALSAATGSTAQPLRAAAAPPPSQNAQPTWLALEPRPTGTGMLRIAVALGPKSLSLTPAKVDEFLAKIEAGKAVRDAYAALPTPRKWTESYTKHAKAFVCVAPCPDAGAAMLPAGQPLEFIAGDAAMSALDLLQKGKPPAAQPLQIVDAKGSLTRGLTDAQARLAVPAAVARPMLLATTMPRVSARRGGDFTNHVATLWVGTQAGQTR